MAENNNLKESKQEIPEVEPILNSDYFCIIEKEGEYFYEFVSNPDKVDFGYEFIKLVDEYILKKVISRESLNNVKLRCHQFLITACKEVSKRIVNNNTELLHKIRNLSPAVCLSPNRPPFKELPLTLANPDDLQKIERQWRLLLTTDFKDAFSGTIPEKGDVFWTKLITIQDVSGNFVFKEISMFALTLCSFPISNATVERVFSRVSSIKTKVRSRMGLDLLSSLIRIKMALDEDGKCCCDFEPNPDMLNYNSTIYDTHKSCEDEDDIFDSLKLL